MTRSIQQDSHFQAKLIFQGQCRAFREKRGEEKEARNSRCRCSREATAKRRLGSETRNENPENKRMREWKDGEKGSIDTIDHSCNVSNLNLNFIKFISCMSLEV